MQARANNLAQYSIRVNTIHPSDAFSDDFHEIS
jgi:hypothetical protein